MLPKKYKIALKIQAIEKNKRNFINVPKELREKIFSQFDTVINKLRKVYDKH